MSAKSKVTLALEAIAEKDQAGDVSGVAIVYQKANGKLGFCYGGGAEMSETSIIGGLDILKLMIIDGLEVEAGEIQESNFDPEAN